MKYISLLLHMYQPPNQDRGIVEMIDRECYTPLTRLLLETGAPVCVNMNYSLTRQLVELGSPSLENLAAADTLEFTDSGAYHPIFPLIDPEDVVRQLELNRMGNSDVLGSGYAPTGVFPPEMAYSPSLPSIFREMGYRWTVTDDIPWASKGWSVPYDRVPMVDGVSVLMRSNFWSNRISFHGESGGDTGREILKGMRDWTGRGDAYLLIAMDGETYGHHRKGMIESFLSPFIDFMRDSGEARMVTPGQLTEIFPPVEAEVPGGSWSTTAEDLRLGKPWPLWDDPDNQVHSGLWKILREVRSLARGCHSDRVAIYADKMLYSCPFWWASEGRFDAVQVRRGLLEIISTAQAICAETGDRVMMDRIMTSACSIPVITGEDPEDAQEG